MAAVGGPSCDAERRERPVDSTAATAGRAAHSTAGAPPAAAESRRWAGLRSAASASCSSRPARGAALRGLRAVDHRHLRRPEAGGRDRAAGPAVGHRPGRRRPRAEATAAAAAPATQCVTVTDPNKLVVDPRSRKRNYQTIDGQGFAKIYIPTFGADYVFTVIEGTYHRRSLRRARPLHGHPVPGRGRQLRDGRHRVSKGSPFNELGLLDSCDALVIETQDDWFVYRVLPMQDEIGQLEVDAARRTAPGSPRRPAYYERSSAARSPSVRLRAGAAGAACPIGDGPGRTPSG